MPCRVGTIRSNVMLLNLAMTVNSKSDNQSPDKKSYHQPVLIRHGRVTMLTTGSAGAFMDGMMSSQSTAGGGGGMMMSDPDAKSHIRRVGTHVSGVGVYVFQYLPKFQKQWGEGYQLGVMADEVAQQYPEAVSIDSDGYRRVNYQLLGSYSI